MTSRRMVVGSVALGLAGSMFGCAPADQDLQQWMADQRRQTVAKVEPISEPKQYVPRAYTEGAAVDPFNSQKLTQALRREAGMGSMGMSLVTPELNRRKEPLESFPLDAMVMVGSLERAGQRLALVKVGELLHQVRTGNYLGQNYGRVTRITENEVALREVVQDAAGDWIERTATLQLQEMTK